MASTPDLTSPTSPTAATTGIDEDLENDDGDQSAPTMALSENFAEHVKTMVVLLVNHAMCRCWKEACYGCEVDHPSQKHHPCLWPIPGYYYQTHFNEIVKKLWNDSFIPAISHYLSANGLYGGVRRIRGAVEAILHELKQTEDIHVPIRQMYDKIDEYTCYKNELLHVPLQMWKDCK